MTDPSMPEGDDARTGRPRGPWTTESSAPGREHGASSDNGARQGQPSSQRPRAPRPSTGPTTESSTDGKRTASPSQKAKGKSGSNTASAGSVKPQDWGLFRTVVALYGLIIIAYGVWQIFAGTESLPGETVRPSATVASSYGALAAVLCGVGAAFVAIAVKFKWANVLWFVCLMIFLGGIGRIFSWAIFGLPNPLMIVVMVLDLVIPPCLLVWHAWIAKANRIRTEMAQGAPQTAGRKKRGKKRS